MSLAQLVNHVAVDVGRPVVLEDRRLRVVAYSPQSGAIDPVREATILRHRASPAVGDWLRDLGVYRTREAMHLPANNDFHMLPRLCVPVVHGAVALGHLWFIESPELMSSDDVGRATQFAEKIGIAWSRLDDDEVSARGIERETARALLVDLSVCSPEAAEDAAERLDVPVHHPVRAYTINCETRAGVDQVQLRAQLERAARAAQAWLRSAIALVRTDHAVLVEPVRAADDVGAAAESIARICEKYLEQFGPVTIGVGSVEPSIGDARLSYAHARAGTTIARTFHLPGPAVLWDRLGAYRGLHAVSERGMRAGDFHNVEVLFAERDGEVLFDTLAAYLRTGGNIQLTAGQLSVHRSSLYNRIARIEGLLGVDLQDGVQRLGLHMAVMLVAVERAS